VIKPDFRPATHALVDIKPDNKRSFENSGENRASKQNNNLEQANPLQAMRKP
jgi:hypothetical protein